MKLSFKKILVVLYAILMAFTSCSGGGGSGDGAGNGGGNSTNGVTAVYVAGNYVDNSKEGESQYISCVWKITESGKTETVLTNDSYPESVCVYNNTIYVSGTTWNSSSESYIACCWIISGDGTVTRYDLSGGLDAPSVYVHDGMAYIAGNCGTTVKTTACYWTINSSGTVTRKDLAFVLDYSFGNANSIFVNDDAVYVAGNYSSGTKEVACCWKVSEGKATTGGITPSYLLSGQQANGILVKDGTIYVCGKLYDEETVTFTGVYWVITDESTTRYDHAAVTNSYVYSIAVDSDGTVYTAGRRNGFYPCYWTGTTITELGSAEGEVNSIYAGSGTVYAAGNYSGTYDSGLVDVACYWKGTTRTDLTDITDKNISNADAAALFVYK